MQANKPALTTDEVVARFNKVSPAKKSKRTVQRWLAGHGITGAGSSRLNWYYPSDAVDAALLKDFSFAQRRVAA